MKVTRDVVIDLWPLYHAGEASADTRALVDEYLATDPELARRLREETPAALEPVPLALAPDHEMKSFTRTRNAIYVMNWPLFLAMMFSFMAFGRIVSDTSWDADKSPLPFAVIAAIAAVLWIVFLVRFVRRMNALR